MLSEQFYERVGDSRTAFLLLAVCIILFYSGITFTFVIPGLKGFNLFSLSLTLFLYFLAANIFAGLFLDKVWVVFMLALILSSIGMGWRLWLEWGEFSLVDHMRFSVYFGYPFVCAVVITIFYFLSNHSLKQKTHWS
ncbi:ABC transporter permease [Sporosarcina sp. OR05]|uniref:ABC transporter permease n=1 Tax=Sporosarcina sp. OR05 TaxID=2969819 RepID=UPI00352AB970